MMGTKERAFAPLCNRSLEDLVPATNFYRHLEAKLDLDFVRELVRATYKDCGRPDLATAPTRSRRSWLPSRLLLAS